MQAMDRGRARAGNGRARPSGRTTTNHQEGKTNMKQRTNSNQDLIDLFDGEYLEIDPHPLYLERKAFCHNSEGGLTLRTVEYTFYGIGGFGIMQGLDLLFG